MKQSIKKSVILVSSLLTLTTQLSFAGNESGNGAGNGGDVFICENPQNNMLLDYYEGLDKGFYTSFGNPGMSIKENFDLWLSQMSAFEVDRIKKYRETGYQMIQDIENIQNGHPELSQLVNITDGDLVDIPDSLELVNPKNCQKFQLVIQTDQKLENKLIKIQRQLWNQIDNVQKALTISHEIIYQEFIRTDSVKNSTYVRFYNEKVISNLSLQTRLDFMKFRDNFFNDLPNFYYTLDPYAFNSEWSLLLKLDATLAPTSDSKNRISDLTPIKTLLDKINLENSISTFYKKYPKHLRKKIIIESTFQKSVNSSIMKYEDFKKYYQNFTLVILYKVKNQIKKEIQIDFSLKADTRNSQIFEVQANAEPRIQNF